MTPEESAVAKSTDMQEEQDLSIQDASLFRVLSSKKKISKSEANYTERTHGETSKTEHKCSKCKFNLGDENRCHVVSIVKGEINNEFGLSNYFSPKGTGMLPGDIVWDFIKKMGRKLDYDEGYVIAEGADGFQCKDCKYHMYSRTCIDKRYIYF
jgi:hypothetical protein